MWYRTLAQPWREKGPCTQNALMSPGQDSDLPMNFQTAFSFQVSPVGRSISLMRMQNPTVLVRIAQGPSRELLCVRYRSSETAAPYFTNVLNY